jgi:ATP phosphoribosyltransferase
MVLATVAGEPDPAAEALRRLGVMRVATKYPRLAARWLEDTGRQAEIVEVKGSVELAPLTGLVEAIVDLTATGTTLRENGLVVREEILTSTARLIANPVAHKLKATAIDEVVGGLRGAEGLRWAEGSGGAEGPRWAEGSGGAEGPRGD